VHESRRRLFVAAPLPPEDAAALLETARASVDPPGARWVAHENLHVTLHFIGWAEAGAVEPLAAALHEVGAATAPLALRFDRVALGPPAGRPRMVWAYLEPSPAFAALASAVGAAAAPYGRAPEARAPRPHVTLARLGAARVRRADWPSVPPPVDALAVDRLELMESTLRRGGASYAALHAFPLATA
jgi:2'-5' RNA ligase